jgi:hypothetical protein
MKIIMLILSLTYSNAYASGCFGYRTYVTQRTFKASEEIIFSKDTIERTSCRFGQVSIKFKADPKVYRETFYSDDCAGFYKAIEAYEGKSLKIVKSNIIFVEEDDCEDMVKETPSGLYSFILPVGVFGFDFTYPYKEEFTIIPIF